MGKKIKYSKEFKIQAVKEYQEGLTPHEIFKLHKINVSTTSKKNPSHCLSRWNKIYKEKGEQGLLEETRGKGGGRPKIPKFKDEKEKIKYLELQVAYLKAENDFLVKLRAQKKKE